MKGEIKIKHLIALPLGLSLLINFSEILLYLDSPYVFFDTPRPTSILVIVSRIVLIFLYCFLVLYLNVYKIDQWLKKINAKWVSLGYLIINFFVFITTFFSFISFQDSVVLKLHEGEARGLGFVWLVFMVICILWAAILKLRAGIREKVVDQQPFVRYSGEAQSFNHDMDIFKQSYLTNFLLPRQKILEPVKVKDFAMFYIDDCVVKGKTFDSKLYFLDRSIQELEEKLNPAIFFRANRQCLINRDAVKHLSPESFGKMELTLKIAHKEAIVISKLKTKDFKDWLVQFST